MIVSFLAEILEIRSNTSVNLESITYTGLIHGQSNLSVSSKSECGNFCLFTRMESCIIDYTRMESCIIDSGSLK